MAVEISAKYTGNKKCELRHQEGALLRTDAPKEIGGEASAFSPTDLMAASLTSCILTTMAMWAERNGFKIDGATARVEKHMTQPPAQRKVARLPVVVTLPSSVPADMREKLQHVGDTCPVKMSLPESVEAPVEYRYGA